MFFLDWLVFLLAFRRLTSPNNKQAPAVRMALGIVVVYVTLLVNLWVLRSPMALLYTAAAAAVSTLGMHGDGLPRLTQAISKLRFPLYLLCVATLAALIFVFVPITTFLTSPGEIGLHLNYLLSVNARDAMVVVYVAAALYAIAITPRMRTLLTFMALGGLALGLIYSYVAPFGYPMMTGLTFEQTPIAASGLLLRVLVDFVAMIVVFLGLWVALIRFGSRPFIIGILLVNVSLGVAASFSVSHDEVGGAGGSEAASQMPNQPLRFSQTHDNVLIIFLDRFMGSYVESILQTDPELGERLSGFTWYPRSVSAGENSIAGVHPMIGGYDYTPVEINTRHKPLRDQSVEAFSILPYNFSRKGYHVNVIEPHGLGFTMAGDCKYLQMPGVTCTHVPLSVVKRRAQQMGFPLNDLATSSYSDLLVLLGSMRGAPYSLKEVLYKRGPWRPFLDHSAGTTFRVWAELQSFPELSQTDAAESNYNYISNILPHEPYFMGENCLPQKEFFEVPRQEVERRGHNSLFSLQHAITARCALLSVANYLDFLKKEHVYDNTKIVIVSDHGIVGDVSDHSTRAVAGGTQNDIFVRTRSVLLVKDTRASGALRISEAYMPNAEVPRIVCEQIGGCVNPYLNNRPIEAHGRDDPFYVSLVPWQFSLQNANSFVINEQLILNGKDPYNAKGWEMYTHPERR